MHRPREPPHRCVAPCAGDVLACRYPGGGVDAEHGRDVRGAGRGRDGAAVARGGASRPCRRAARRPHRPGHRAFRRRAGRRRGRRPHRRRRPPRCCAGGSARRCARWSSTPESVLPPTLLALERAAAGADREVAGLGRVLGPGRGPDPTRRPPATDAAGHGRAPASPPSASRRRATRPSASPTPEDDTRTNRCTPADRSLRAPAQTVGRGTDPGPHPSLTSAPAPAHLA